MEFYRYLKLFHKRGWIAVLLLLIGAISAYGFTAQQPTTYSSSSTLLINPAVPNQAISYLSGAPVTQLAASYDAYMHSKAFDKLVSAATGIPEGITSALSTQLINNTYFFIVQVTWSNPTDSQRIADTAVRIFIDQNKQMQQASAAASTGSTDLASSQAYYRAEIARVRKEKAQAQNDTSLDPGARDQRVSSLDTDLSTLEDTYYKLLAVGSTANNSTALSTATIVDGAAPGVPLKASAKRNTLFGALSGLVLGVGLIFLLDYLDYSLRTPEELEHLIGQAPIGIIGLIRGQERDTESQQARGKKKGDKMSPKRLPREATESLVFGGIVEDTMPRNGNGNAAYGQTPGSARETAPMAPQLVTLRTPRAPISEAFRALRTNLEFSSLDTPLKTMMVTSMLPREGKSTIAANLAVVLAQAGKRVILVDTDLRRPSLHRVFDLKNNTGFTSALLMPGSPDQALAATLRPTAVPNLRLLTSGPLPHNPSELLSSERVAQIMAALEAQADIVLFDTPPMGPITDAVLLSKRVTGTLLVIRAGSTRRPVILNGLNTLNKVGAHTLGVVFNMINESDVSNYSYYYYYTSGYYAQDPEPAHTLPLS